MTTLYEVTVDIAEGDAARFAAYMTGRHIPDIIATGCFTAARFAQAGPARFRTSYEAPDQAALDRYLEDHAAHFRADFARHFPAGATATRAVWTVVWES